MKLFWQLRSPIIEAGVVLFLMAGAYISTGYGRPSEVLFAFLAALLIIGNSTSFAGYRAISLGSKAWNRDQKVIACLRFLAYGIATVLNGLWWCLGIAAIALMVRLLINPQPNRKLLRDLVAGSEGDADIGLFPATLVAQAVYRPQLKMWGRIWGIYLVFGGVSAVASAVWGIDFRLLFAIVTVWVVTLAFGTLRSTLRDYVIFGGLRHRWARATIISSLTGIVPALLLCLALSMAKQDPVVQPLAAALLIPCGVTLFEFTKWRNAYVPALFTLVIAVLFWVWATGRLDVWGVTTACVGIYAVWALGLNSYVRQVDVFRSGLAGWFGVAK